MKYRWYSTVIIATAAATVVIAAALLTAMYVGARFALELSTREPVGQDSDSGIAFLAGAVETPRQTMISQGEEGRHRGVGVGAPNFPTESKPLAKWVQLIGRNAPPWGADTLVRAVMPARAACPELRLTDPDNGIRIAMTRRTNPYGQAFPIEVCQAKLDVSGVQIAFFPDGTYLRVPQLWSSSPVRRLIMFGDSGCRGIRAVRNKQQACDPQEGWPLERIAKHAIQTAENGDADPYIVIHLGDYMYRDHETWEIWYNDFFKPAAPLLEAAPWVMVRGNHESCTFPDHKGPKGFFLLLDPTLSPDVKQCGAAGSLPVTLASSRLDVRPDLSLVVADSAEIFQLKGTNNPHGEALRQEIASIKDLLDEQQRAWLVTHVPLQGLAEPDAKNTIKPPDWSEQLRAILEKSGVWPRLDYIVSGDSHFFHVLAREADGASVAQIIVGTGGVLLDKSPEPAERQTGDNLGNGLPNWLQQSSWYTKRAHGYLVSCWDEQSITHRFFEMKVGAEKWPSCIIEGAPNSVHCRIPAADEWTLPKGCFKD